MLLSYNPDMFKLNKIIINSYTQINNTKFIKNNQLVNKNKNIVLLLYLCYNLK